MVKKVTISLSSLIANVCSASILFTLTCDATAASQRKSDAIAAFRNAPSPALSSSGPDECLAKMGYALTCYYLDTDLTTADGYVIDICSRFPIPDSLAVQFDFEWALPISVYMLSDSVVQSRMSPAASLAVQHQIFNLINQRSQFTNVTAAGSEHEILGSENHDALHKSAYYLGAGALLALNYPTQTLADGYSIASHYSAWDAAWKRTLTSRALNGALLEMNTKGYLKYTLSSILNIVRFGKVSSTRTYAWRFMDLVMALRAQDYLPGTGYGGSSGLRIYKTSQLTHNYSDSMNDYHYLYNWTQSIPNNRSIHAVNLVAAMNDFEESAIIQHIATTPKTGFNFTQHCLGKGSSWNDQDLFKYNIANSTDLRHDTYRCDEFIMGSFTFNPAVEYTTEVEQNRAMGAIMDGGENNRVMIHAITDGAGSTYADITGICRDGVLAAALDASHWQVDAIGVFISDQLWNNSQTATVPNSHSPDPMHWVFSHNGPNGNAYCAILIGSGGYTVQNTSYGKTLRLTNENSPVIIQMGRAADYSGFADFTNQVINTAHWFEPGSNKLGYQGIQGAPAVRIWGNSLTIPSLNNIPVDLNPSMVYDSPYIQLQEGQTSVLIQSPGIQSKQLDFSY